MGEEWIDGWWLSNIVAIIQVRIEWREGTCSARQKEVIGVVWKSIIEVVKQILSISEKKNTEKE